MRLNKIVQKQKIVKAEQSKWTDILKIPKDNLINSAFITFRAYANPNGSDAKSLYVDVISKENCNVSKKAFNIHYDYTKCEAILSFDKSKLSPLKSSGYVVVEIKGNYKFQEMVKIPWCVDKMNIYLNENDIEINDISPKDTIVWKKGTEINVLSFKVNCPKDVKENGNIWYSTTECPKISLDIDTRQDVSVTDFILSDESTDFDKEYTVKYKCDGEIKETKDLGFKLKLKNGSVVLKTSDQLSLNFKPKCEVVILNIDSSDRYVLGNDAVTLYAITLKNETKSGGATAKLNAEIVCTTYPDLFKLNKSDVVIEPQKTDKIKLSLNKEKLTQMPDDDISVEFKLTVDDAYTLIKKTTNSNELTEEYKQTITLKK